MVCKLGHGRDNLATSFHEEDGRRDEADEGELRFRFANVQDEANGGSNNSECSRAQQPKEFNHCNGSKVQPIPFYGNGRGFVRNRSPFEHHRKGSSSQRKEAGAIIQTRLSRLEFPRFRWVGLSSRLIFQI